MSEDHFGEDPVQAAMTRQEVSQGAEGIPGVEVPGAEAAPAAPEGRALKNSPAESLPQGLEQLFNEHHRRVFQAAYRITGNAMDAEDVLQTVFLRLLRREGGAPLPETAGSYLHLAAVNGALDVVRARASAKATSLEEVESVLSDAPRLRPDGRQEGREIREGVRRALGRLNPKAAELFVLRYLEGYSNREIARMLRKPKASVAVGLHRARRRLREEIRQFAGGRR